MSEALIIVRWLHVFFGTIWIGLLYSSNLRRGSTSTVSSGEQPQNESIAPVWLGGFPWSAGGTVIFGTAYFFAVWRRLSFSRFVLTSYGLTILTASSLGLAMFANALAFWLIRKPLRLPAVEDRTATVSPERVALIERRATLVTRANVLLSVPMLFFMVAASHHSLMGRADIPHRIAWFAVVGALLFLVEVNAFVGLWGVCKRPLESVRGAVGAGFALWASLFVMGKLLTLGLS